MPSFFAWLCLRQSQAKVALRPVIQLSYSAGEGL
jgi:hypothetical protein